MKCCKQDGELANTSPQTFPSKEPNPETLEAIREGDAFFAARESGRFDNGADLIDAALKAPDAGENLTPEETVVLEVPDRRGTYLAIFVRFDQMSKHLNLHIDEVGNADKPFLPSGRLNSRYPSCVILEP